MMVFLQAKRGGREEGPQIEKAVREFTTPEKAAEKEEDEAAPEEERKAQSRKAVAVAGEYWKIAKRERRDVSRGQSTLRRAKEVLEAGKYSEATGLAKQAITELKNAPAQESRYTVKKGDNLWKIAGMKQHYGRGAGWVRIWRANEKKVPDFDIIYRGQVLVIPE